MATDNEKDALDVLAEMDEMRQAFIGHMTLYLLALKMRPETCMLLLMELSLNYAITLRPDDSEDESFIQIVRSTMAQLREDKRRG